jgi:prepilin signal peptidase PulO-like enzyme (type II secretory pathway)
MDYYWYLILFIFGLAVGSFINVITLRYQPGQNPEGVRPFVGPYGARILDKKIIGGRSHCPICLKTLDWYELIPIFSFFIQRGKCRSCGHKISFQYPLVEILSGLLFVFVPLTLINADFYADLRGLTIISAVWVIIFLLFLILSIIDFRQSIIPNQINLSLGILGLILIVVNHYYDKFNYLSSSFLGHYAVIFGLRENIWLNYLVAALLGMAIFGAIILLSRGKAMGLGDFKLVGALGLIFGWPDILMVIFLAFIIGALVSIVFLIKKKKKMKDAIPFGPFLVIGAALTFFLGYQVIEGYFKLFGLY